jgi:hypothetical protein
VAKVLDFSSPENAPVHNQVYLIQDFLTPRLCMETALAFVLNAAPAVPYYALKIPAV